MTNKIETIISAIEGKLILAGVKKTIRYPEQYKNIGNQYPLAIIKEGRQEYIATSGNRYEYDLYISIVLVGVYGTNRMKQMQDLQVAVFNQLFPSATFGGLAMNVNPISVDTGEIMKGSDLSAFAGHNEAASFREITIQFRVQDTRR